MLDIPERDYSLEFSGGRALAQTVQLEASAALVEIRLKVRCIPDAAVAVGILGVAGDGTPSSGLADTETQFAQAAFDWHAFPLSSPLQVKAGDKLAIVMSILEGLRGSAKCAVSGAGVDAYAAGAPYARPEGERNWVAQVGEIGLRVLAH